MTAKPPIGEAAASSQTAAQAAASPGAPVISSHALFRGAREVIIVHGNEAYRLRITRQDKLILTK